jgi:RNA polymerase sigma-70 factor (ECF subfamily)
VSATANVRAAERELGVLVASIAAGDQAAMAALYDQTNRVVYGLALRILRDPGAAEEATLDVYMQVWRKAATYDISRGNPSAWLLCMARTRALDRLRSSASARNSETALEDSPIERAIATDNPEASTLATERQRIVRAALERLSPEQREVIDVAYFSGLSHSEIAAKLNLPLGTVKTRIRLGMEKLREYLAPLSDAEGGDDDR